MLINIFFYLIIVIRPSKNQNHKLLKLNQKDSMKKKIKKLTKLITNKNNIIIIKKILMSKLNVYSINISNLLTKSFLLKINSL